MLDHQYYRPLGRTGLQVSPLCLGTDNFSNPTPEAEAFRIFDRAIASGINLIDTVNNYAEGESERIIGRALRENLLLVTKCYYPTGKKGINDRGTSRKHLIRACEDSLQRLQTDYIDLYQMHRLPTDMPLEEIMGTLTDLVCQGKIRYFGFFLNTAPWMKGQLL